MIDRVIDHIIKEINAYFSVFSSIANDHVIAGSLFDLAGGQNAAIKDKLLLSLINVEQDKTYHSVDVYKKTDHSKSQIIKPEIKINLYFLFIANHSDYNEALKNISRVIAFFQHRHVFDIPADTTLSNETARLSFELFSLSFEQQNHIWGMLGGKYIPSVMYKAGILNIQDAQVEAEVTPVDVIEINENQ